MSSHDIEHPFEPDLYVHGRPLKPGIDVIQPTDVFASMTGEWRYEGYDDGFHDGGET